MKIKNLNHLAIEVTNREGGKKSLPIGQVKEVIRHLRDILHENSMPMLCILLKKTHKRKYVSKCR